MLGVPLFSNPSRVFRRAFWRGWGALFFTGVVGTWMLAWGADPTQAVFPSWSGTGTFRILVVVAAHNGERQGDESIAQCELDLQRWMQQAGVDGRADIGSFEVHAYHPTTGEPLKSPTPYGASPYDRPCRYDDARIPDAYASRVGRASETPDGRPSTVIRQREARLFNREMTGNAGRLSWSHRGGADEAVHYAIYFSEVASNVPPAVSPAPWLGDADVLRVSRGAPLGGHAHFTAGVGDLNGDGLFDIVAGNEKGDLVWYANRGTPTSPLFVGCHLLVDESGPIDVGWYAAPTLVDWDDDGDPDLLVGTSGNVILWWRNAGNATAQRLHYAGFVMADGKRLEVPEQPVAEDSHGIFARDYYNQPWVGDFDGDGVRDIVTGGYTTGQICWYRGEGRQADGTPRLVYAGKLYADGKPIDTIWAAAPCCLDLNGDQRLDVVTGAWRWSGIAEPARPGDEDLLHCYLAVGDAREGGPPNFARVPFPATAPLPAGSIARPSAVDANGDGLVDLLVSESGGNAYLFANVGARDAPRFDTTPAPLSAPWGFVRNFDAAAVAADVDGREGAEFLQGNLIYAIDGPPTSPEWRLLGAAHVDGKPIEHPGPGYGDPYYYALLCHWDDDQRADILWGTHQGHILIHKNLAGDDPLAFAPGARLLLESGEAIRLGPLPAETPDGATDFTILQGSRVVMGYEDLDGDGVRDLLAGDTFGKIWAFLGMEEQTTARRFQPGVQLAELSTRPESIACMDWNNDGRRDLLIGGTAVEPIHVFVNASQPGRPAIERPIPVAGLPYLFWGPKIRASDWNRDGDVDLMVQSEYFSFWIERSFLDHGYRSAQVAGQLETKPTSNKFN